MRIIDLTQLFTRFNHINYYCLNPCIVHIKDDIFAVTYRTLYYNLPTSSHPWGRWFSDARLFEKFHPKFASTCPQESINKVQYQEICRETQAKSLIPGTAASQNKIYRINKVRSKLGPDYIVPLTDPTISAIDFNILDYDSTSLAIIQIDENKNVTVLGTTNNLFQYEMNQDCRIYKEDDHFVLVYNGFIGDHTCMLQRLLYIPDTYDHAYLTCESYCNETYKTGIEKNWCIFNEKYFIYSMESSTNFIPRNLPYNIESIKNRQLLDEGLLVTQQEFKEATQEEFPPEINLDEPIPAQDSQPDADPLPEPSNVEPQETAAEMRLSTPEIGQLVKYYGGGKDMYFSLGTPCLAYDTDSYITVGHIKIDHRKLIPNTNFSRFFKKYLDVPSKSIHKHGAYVYFMFLAKFSKDGILTHISNAFIPSQGNQHLPYYLVFAMGITRMNDTFFISYGEGDVRCKLLALTKREFNDLLIPIENITPESYEFELLTGMPRRRILVLGYYGAHNTGDDCFGYIFEMLNRPECTFMIRNPYKINYIPNYVNKIVVGGGDVLNPYFMTRINELLKTSHSPIQVMAFSVGIPYPDVINREFLAPFSKIVLRNPLDVPFVKKYHDDVVYMPDLVYLLPKFIKTQPQFTIDTSYLNIGIFLTRTIYRRGYECEYYSLVHKLAKAFGQLLDKFNSGPAEDAPPQFRTTPGYTSIQISSVRTPKPKYGSNLYPDPRRLTLELAPLNKPVRFYFVPMGVAPQNANENDIIINRHIARIMRRPLTEAVFLDQAVNIEELIEKPYGYIPLFNYVTSQMDYCICMRFHAHIACIMHKIPFTSIATTRKCEQLMRENGLDTVVSMVLSKDFNPIDINLSEMVDKISKHIENRTSVKQKMIEIMLKKTPDISRLEEFIYESCNETG